MACLGTCPVGNNAMLQVLGRSIWFKDLNADHHIEQLFEYAAGLILADHVSAPTGELAAHVFERYTAPPNSDYIAFGDVSAAPIDFNGIDPVCMMTVDPATAKWRSTHNGTEYCFCAPGCKGAFDEAPGQYLGGAIATTSAGPDPVAEPVAEHTSTLLAPDIFCEMCTKTIARAVRKEAGVVDVIVDERSKRVEIHWSAPATLDAIRARMTRAGYPPSDA